MWVDIKPVWIYVFTSCHKLYARAPYKANLFHFSWFQEETVFRLAVFFYTHFVLCTNFTILFTMLCTFG